MNNNPYVFISYAHLDCDSVLPCINAMKQSGINLWFDDGIEAGSEWPEFIAEKVVTCTKFVLFISKAYLNSQNCKRELNFAISRKKDILSIFLEDVDLSPGMEMQLGTYQAIYRKRFDSSARFHASLCAESFFNVCRTRTAAPPPLQPKLAQVGPIYLPPIPSVTVNANSNLPYKNKFVAALLAFLFGSFGVHRFYLKQNKLGVLYLLLFWTYIPGFLGFFEAIFLLLMPKDKFERKYKCRTKY